MRIHNAHGPVKLGHVFTAEPLKIRQSSGELMGGGINGLSTLNCNKLFQELFKKKVKKKLNTKIQSSIKTCNTYRIQKELFSNVLFQELLNNTQCFFLKFNLLSHSSFQSCFPVTEQTQRADFHKQLSNCIFIFFLQYSSLHFSALHHVGQTK